MKKILAFVMIIASLASLIACGKNDGVPDGMQLVRGGEDVGYYFYGPEEWTVANLGNISATYASNVDSSSITYVETDMPSGTVQEYFTNSLAEFPTPPTVLEPQGGETVTFGTAESAVKFVYDHEYSGHKFRTMQIFVKHGERFGIFTYTSFLENKSSADKTQYEYYLEKVDAVIKNFKFTERTNAEAAPEYEVVDGYKLISDKSVAKFSLYVPEDFKVEYSSGISCASLDDGSNITLTRATSTGVSVADYWNNRKSELEAIVGGITLVEEVKSTSFGNAKNAASYEYTYVYNGTVYHVYQVFAVTTFDGFVFTYTATDENYSKHLDTIMKITEKVEF